MSKNLIMKELLSTCLHGMTQDSKSEQYYFEKTKRYVGRTLSIGVSPSVINFNNGTQNTSNAGIWIKGGRVLY